MTDRAGAGGHHNILCENCGVRIGGCRCMAQDKATYREGLCATCKETDNSPPTPERLKILKAEGTRWRG